METIILREIYSRSLKNNNHIPIKLSAFIFSHRKAKGNTKCNQREMVLIKLVHKRLKGKKWGPRKERL